MQSAAQRNPKIFLASMKPIVYPCAEVDMGDTLTIKLQDIVKAESGGKPTALSCLILKAFLETLPCDKDGWIAARTDTIHQRTGITPQKQITLLRMMRKSGVVETKMVFPPQRMVRLKRKSRVSGRRGSSAS